MPSISSDTEVRRTTLHSRTSIPLSPPLQLDFPQLAEKTAMSNAPQEPTDSHASTDEGPDYTGMPGWVKWLVITAVVLGVVLLVALLVGGDHGPGRHTFQGPSTDTVAGPTALR